MTSRCIFCRIVAGQAPATIVRRWRNAIAFVPHPDPVTDGHLLIVPRVHTPHASARPLVTGMAFWRAAQLARALGIPHYNLIVNAGKYATQTIPHLHVHLVPRREGDGLTLPWTGQRRTGDGAP
jgi:histidine triad (HIT) family protein